MKITIQFRLEMDLSHWYSPAIVFIVKDNFISFGLLISCFGIGISTPINEQKYKEDREVRK